MEIIREVERVGPSLMYACQRTAFESGKLHSARLTDSTLESPPSYIPPNLIELASIRRSVISNLPSSCVHCNAVLLREYIISRSDNSIIAYCKSKNGCGKSQVLFAPINLAKPYYEQVCVYEIPDVIPEGSEQYTRHGVSYRHPDELCKKCNQPSRSHKSGVDQNGWVKIGESCIDLPGDWPEL